MQQFEVNGVMAKLTEVNSDIAFLEASISKKRNLIIFVCVVLLVGFSAFVGGFFVGKLNIKSQTESRSHESGEIGIQNKRVSNMFQEWRESAFCPNYGLSSACKKKTFVLISLDGFRADYLMRNKTPAIARLLECGVHSPYIRSVYPTKTFPNHYSIITGLYPESHGITDNKIYDPKFDAKFTAKNENESQNPRWWGGEPIWVTVVKANKTSAAYFWPGSDVKINGYRPTYYKHYDHNTPFETRVDTLISWLYLPEEDRPDFITMYLAEPDNTGHKYGPESEQVNKALHKVDSMIDRLMEKMHKRQLTECVNLMIVADHGMAQVPASKHIRLDKYMKIDDQIKFIRFGAFGQIRPYSSTARKLREILDSLDCSVTKNTHIRPYKKGKMPIRFHYSENERISPILIDVDEGYALTGPNKPGKDLGEHGYDNMDHCMRALFLAIGPDFKQHFQARPFQNIELYDFICKVIGINPSANNGTEHSLNHLRSEPMKLEPLKANAPMDFNGIFKTTNASGCTCRSVSELYDRFKFLIAQSNHSRLVNLHDPFTTSFSESTIYRLINEDFILYFDTASRGPICATFTLSSSINFQKPLSQRCWRSDSRIGEKSPTCSKYHKQAYSSAGIRMGGLFNESFASSNESAHDVEVTTNAIPVYSNFLDKIIPKFYKFIFEKLESVKVMNIVTGPMFKSSASEDGIDSSLRAEIPSHFFYVLTWCEDTKIELSNCIPGKLQMSAFILPHIRKIPHCQTIEEWATRNSARVRDVELFTGIQFYSKFPADIRAKLVVTLPEAEKK